VFHFEAKSEYNIVFFSSLRVFPNKDQDSAGTAPSGTPPPAQPPPPPQTRGTQSPSPPDLRPIHTLTVQRTLDQTPSSPLSDLRPMHILGLIWCNVTRPATHSYPTVSCLVRGVVLRVVVCGVVLVVSCVVWGCSCCVYVCVTCFSSYPTVQHTRGAGGPPPTVTHTNPYSATNTGPDPPHLSPFICGLFLLG